ncbi:Chaperone protein DnaJ [subsurface metagenome]
MVNYYEVLGIDPVCSTGEIKRSFRKRAKELHPDLKYANRQYSDEKMRNLLAAYETLSNPQKRSAYDRAFAIHFSKPRFNYREYLRSRSDDLISQSKLIFYHLLNSEANEALQLYDSLSQSRSDFSLERCLGREDYMDCVFLMAEALETNGEFIRASELYKHLCLLEAEQPYFHHFLDEIIERLRSITCFKMVAILPPQTSIGFIEELIRFNFSRKDNAFFYKKIAEIYCSLGQMHLALSYLDEGLKLDQKLPGVKKLKEKIGYTGIPVG